VSDERAYLAEHLIEIVAAETRIQPYIRRTPALASDLDPRLVVKAECFQPTGSFKVRGAFNAVLQLAARSDPPPGVIAVSSGNHAQALALAARTAGLPALILIPEDANPAKIAATRALGAEVVTQGITFANREQRLREVAAERGYHVVHPFDDWDVVHGAGTAALEVIEDGIRPHLVVTPVGGGGLLSGTALAVKALQPDATVYAVEPEQAADAAATLAAGALQTLPASPTTLADGVRSIAVGSKTLEVMLDRRLVDGIVTVSEAEIADAVVTAWERLKLALEPTAVLPLAGWLAGKLPAATGPVVLLATGGNADLGLVARLLANARGQGSDDA
jgi:threonine dehydratase